MTDIANAAAQWWRDNIDGPIFGARWVTLTSGTHVKLDSEGRIAAGGPKEWHGVHVRDVPTLAKRLRALEGFDCDGSTLCSHGCGSTFRTREAGVAALLEANPALAQYLQDEGGSDSRKYREWMRGGRRGKKPELAAGDGRFDALNERLELKGGRKVSSWLEAVYVTVPPSRKWDDFPDRIEILEEATALDLRLPDTAERRELARTSAADCRQRVDASIGELLTEAKEARLTEAPPGELPEAPF